MPCAALPPLPRTRSRSSSPIRSSRRPSPPHSSSPAPLPLTPALALPRSGDLNKGQKTLWVTLPGAFTPT